MNVTTKRELNLKVKTSPPLIDAMQYDTDTRSIEFFLFSGSDPWPVPIDVSVAVGYKTKENTMGFYDKLSNGLPAIKVIDNTITVILAQEMLTVPGRVEACLILSNENLDQLKTFPFYIRVTESPITNRSKANSPSPENYIRLEWLEKRLKELKDSGVFNGKDGAAGAPGPQGPEGKQGIQGERGEPGIAPVILCETSGKVISASDSALLPLQCFKLFGRTTQNGTPTPDAPVPLENVGDNGSVAVSVTGKNLFGGDALADKVVEVFRGVKDTTAKTIKYLASNSNAEIAIFNQFKPNTRYTIIWTSNENSTGATANLKVEYTDGTSETLRYAESAGVKRQIVFVTSATKTANKLRSVNNSGTAYLLYEESGIFEGVLTADDFEAYTAQTLTVRKPVDLPVFLPGIPVTSGGNYTDEIGQQWFCDEADFASGKYVQRVGKIDSYVSEDISSAYISTTGELSAGATVLYALPDPIEHDLTAEELAQYTALHANYPNTAIFNDGGADMEVKYVADTKQYIDSKFAELASAIANNV